MMKNGLFKGTLLVLVSSTTIFFIKSIKKQKREHKLKKFLQKKLDKDVDLGDVLSPSDGGEVDELLSFIDFYENLDGSQVSKKSNIR